MKQNKIKEFLANMLFPKNTHCVLCDKELNNQSICTHCLEQLPKIPSRVCLRCGQATNQYNDYCNNCKKTKVWYYTKCRSPYIYQDNIRRMIYDIKFNNCWYLFDVFKKAMNQTYLAFGVKFDYIIPVPLSDAKLKSRHYNQSLKLAELIDTYTPIITNCLIKIKDNVDQAKLNGQERVENIKNVYNLHNYKFLKDKTILLIDDVYTTGSTINECARLLISKAKANKVYALTLAHSYEPDQINE